ncbi:MAG TPA: hypothetical protein VEV19_02165 [Ktedonobacteraceae bacterium]|nr:hypothetical protein [Ktedonobacteraceae bacterium]
MLVIVDADALIATSVPSDSNHAIAESIIRSCQAQKVHYIIPSTAVCEAITVLHSRKANAKRELQKIQSKNPVAEKERQELQRQKAKAQQDLAIYTPALDFLLHFINTAKVRYQSIDKEIVFEAMAKFKSDGPKSDSIFDAIVAVLAIRYDADAVFSFDHVYPTMGLRLAKDLFP